MTAYKKYGDIEIFGGELTNHEFPWHYHECYTIVWIQQGRIMYDFRREQILLSPNNVLIVEPFEVHRNHTQEKTKYQAIFLPIYYLESKFCTQLVNSKRIINALSNITDQLKTSPESSQVNEMVNGLCTLFGSEHDLLISTEIFKCLKPISIKGIENNLTIEFLSQQAHLSKFHFQREFKKSFGLTVGQLKQQQKTKAAKRLLELKHSSTDVAHELGYYDQSHFIKYFKKMWAVLPKEI